MIEHAVARHAAVPVAMRPCESGAGGGESLEAEALQVARTAHVPGVGKDEASRLVQFVKGATLVGNAGADMGHATVPQLDVRDQGRIRCLLCARRRTRAPRIRSLPHRPSAGGTAGYSRSRAMAR